MKKLAGPVRIELAQYRELAAFSQFGSDLSQDTLDRLRQGERIVEILKQPQYKPIPVERQALTLYVLTKRYLCDIPLERVLEFEREFLDYIEEHHPHILQSIRDTKDISAEVEAQIQSAIDTFRAKHPYDK